LHKNFLDFSISIHDKSDAVYSRTNRVLPLTTNKDAVLSKLSFRISE